MLIECPRCGARARLRKATAHAKVRCGSCGATYVARGASAPTGLVWGGLAGVLALLVVLALVRRAARDGDAGGAESARPAAEAAAPPPGVLVHAAEPGEDEATGWEAAPVQAAAELHEAAHRGDRAALGDRLWAPGLAERAGAGAAGGDLVGRAVDELRARGEEGLVAGWRPYDGEVLRAEGDRAAVRLSVTPREGSSVEKRHVDWELVRDGGVWKAWSWSRWISPEEERADQPRTERVVLSDGSLVVERATQTLGHLEDTPPELRRRIDELCATMLDPAETTGAARARAELVGIGRPAIPILLDRLHDTPIRTQEDAILCNIVIDTLRNITGQSFGFRPQIAEGSSVGTTEERRSSAVRQWFAWWDMYADDFTEKEVEDGLEGVIELTDEDRRWLERHADPRSPER